MPTHSTLDRSMLRWTVIGLALLAFSLVRPATAQPVQVRTPDGRTISPQQIEQMKAAAAARRAKRGGGDAGKKKEEDKKEEKPKEEKEGEEKKEEAVATVKRPTEPPAKVDREELKVRPDEHGKVQFSFYGQRWEDVLQWYADVAKLTFDWQELPEGYLNLTARRKYSLKETGDMLNARLLARGFTSVVNGEVLSVYKIDKLDPSLIPRVEADDLEDYSPHDFVRVRFELPKSMEPPKAAEDVKILLSPNAKVQPLLATKRLHVIDAVVNLRMVRDLIYAEQAAVTEDIRPLEFEIQYRRADYVADQVMIVLGLDPASRKSPQELQIEQQRMQLAMAMMKQNKDVSHMLKKGGPEVFIAVNKRRNTLHVNAPPEMVPMISRAIEQFDVPDDGGAVPTTGQLVFKKYVTATASTDAVVSALKEIGRLHPLTQLQSDKPNRTIYATATEHDHAKIQGLIDKLDGSGRQLHVIWLNKRSPADQIAGTINLLMGVDEEDDKKNNNNSRRRFFGFYGYGNDEEPDAGKMRLQADVENNRLLLWATMSEYDEVSRLLEQIGALASPGQGNPNPVRVVDVQNPQQLGRLLERLQGSWSGENPIEIQGAPQDAPAESDADVEQDRTRTTEEPKDKLTAAGQATVHFAQIQRPQEGAVRWINGNAAEAQSADEGSIGPAASGDRIDRRPLNSARRKAAPPIKITVTPDGRLLITSEDLAALDRFEELIEQLEPPAPDFVSYRLRNTRASLVEILLSEYFEDELKDQKETLYDYWGDYAGTRDKDTGPTTLGKRRLLRFIWDNDSNTLIVQNASPAQLRIIDKLIEIYDRPVGEDSVAARRTEVVPLKYSRAKDIATSLKEVYRDLLSSKDKEFQGRDGEAKTRTETHYRIFGASQENDNSNQKSAPVKMAFEGALSIGVDEISNTLIISAQDQVFDNVLQIVKELDEKARPNTVVQVHEARVAFPGELKQALANALGQPWPGGKPQAAAAGKGGKEQQNGKKQKGGDQNGQQQPQGDNPG